MMNRKILLVASASLLGWSLSQASITSVPTWNYSGGFYCYAPVFTTADQTVDLTGHQSSFGALGLSILTDTPNDPTLTINNSINNTSSFAWTEYIVSVAMNQSFTINSAGVVAPGGWAASITQPGAPVAGIYTGIIDYLGGTPVSIYPLLNSSLNFGYQVTFSGSTSYSLTQTANPVPEPGAWGFLTTGGLLMGGWTLARRRQVRLQTIA
jgi:hypothetical protein